LQGNNPSPRSPPPRRAGNGGGCGIRSSSAVPSPSKNNGKKKKKKTTPNPQREEKKKNRKKTQPPKLVCVSPRRLERRAMPSVGLCGADAVVANVGLFGFFVCLFVFNSCKETIYPAARPVPCRRRLRCGGAGTQAASANSHPSEERRVKTETSRHLLLRVCPSPPSRTSPGCGQAGRASPPPSAAVLPAVLKRGFLGGFCCFLGFFSAFPQLSSRPWDLGWGS